MLSKIHTQIQPDRLFRKRRASVLVLAAFFLVVAFAFTAFTIDIGFIALTGHELQNGADSASLAAAAELGTNNSPMTREANSRVAARDLAALHTNGELNSTTIDPMTDVRLGYRRYNFFSREWVIDWGRTPYNAVEVTAKRTTSNGTGLPLFISPVIDHSKANVTRKSRAALRMGSGFLAAPLPTGSAETVPVFPITLDIYTWNMLVYFNVGPDNYAWNEAGGTVTPGTDGEREVAIFPNSPNITLPSGNRGTLNFGPPDLAVVDLERQIEYGLSADDLAYHGGSLDTSSGPIEIPGSVGVTSNIEDELQGRIGEVVAIPLFSSVTGNGATSTYTIVKFVGARIMAVNLKGPLSKRKLVIQPAILVHKTVRPATSLAAALSSPVGAIYTLPALVE